MTKEEFEADQEARHRADLAEMERQHAEHPFRGLRLRLLEGSRRVVAHYAAEAAQ